MIIRRLRWMFKIQLIGYFLKDAFVDKINERKHRGREDEVGPDDRAMPGGPGTPTVVMKGWDALEAILNNSNYK